MTTPVSPARTGSISSPPTSLVAAGVIVAVASVVWLYRLAGDQALLAFTYTHWAFTYDHGVVKRALVGEVVQPLVPAAGLWEAVSRIGLVLAAAVAAALCVVFWRPWARWKTAGTFAFGVLATTHVATVQHAFYDLARFDQLGLLLALLCIAVIMRAGTSAGATVTVLAACAIGLFVHEAFLFMYSPLIAACWMWRTGGRFTEPRVLAFVGVNLGVVALLRVLGPPDIGEQALVQELTARHGTWISPKSVQVLYGDLLAEMKRSLLLMVSVRRIVQHAVLAAMLLPTLWLLLAVRREASLGPGTREASGRETLLLASALSPLVLYAIGIDFARWWALALTNVLVALGLLLATSAEWAAALSRVFTRRPAIVWAVLAVNLIAGPLGVASSPFPHLESGIRETVLWLVRAVRG